MLTRASILAANDLAHDLQAVAVPEWGGTVHVRVMTGAERSAFEAAVVRDKDDAIPRLVALTCCDESGARIFGDEDLDAIGGKSSRVLVRLYDAAIACNKLRDSDVDASEKN